MKGFYRKILNLPLSLPSPDNQIQKNSVLDQDQLSRPKIVKSLPFRSAAEDPSLASLIGSNCTPLVSQAKRTEETSRLWLRDTRTSKLSKKPSSKDGTSQSSRPSRCRRETTQKCHSRPLPAHDPSKRLRPRWPPNSRCPGEQRHRTRPHPRKDSQHIQPPNHTTTLHPTRATSVRRQRAQSRHLHARICGVGAEGESVDEGEAGGVWQLSGCAG